MRAVSPSSPDAVKIDVDIDKIARQYLDTVKTTVAMPRRAPSGRAAPATRRSRHSPLPPMTADLLFQFANPLALTGWVALALSPLAPRVLHTFAAVVVPTLLSIAYAAIVLAFWNSAEGGFDSLQSVAQLFANRWLLLAGWLHYLAFDLLVGAWQVRTARRESISHALVMPCLLATFLFGPAGYLLFQGLRLSLRTHLARSGT
jgi:hypothetical protein